MFSRRDTLSWTCCFDLRSLSLSLSTTPVVSTSECSAMKSQLTITPEVLTCCTLCNHIILLTLLVIYEECLNYST